MTNVDIFKKEQFSLQFLFSLLQVYIVYRVSFIFRLNVFLVSVCTKGFAYLLCWPQRRGLELLVCKRRFSFHKFCNFFAIFFLFFYPRHLPTPTTHNFYPLRTHEPRHLATLVKYGFLLRIVAFSFEGKFFTFFGLQDMFCRHVPQVNRRITFITTVKFP